MFTFLGARWRLYLIKNVLKGCFQILLVVFALYLLMFGSLFESWNNSFVFCQTLFASAFSWWILLFICVITWLWRKYYLWLENTLRLEVTFRRYNQLLLFWTLPFLDAFLFAMLWLLIIILYINIDNRLANNRLLLILELLLKHHFWLRFRRLDSVSR